MLKTVMCEEVNVFYRCACWR